MTSLPMDILSPELALLLSGNSESNYNINDSTDYKEIPLSVSISVKKSNVSDNDNIVQKVILDENRKSLSFHPDFDENSNVIEKNSNPILVSNNDNIVQKVIHDENRKSLSFNPDIDKNSNAIENNSYPILVSDSGDIVQKVINGENRKTLNIYPDIEKYSNVIENNNNPILVFDNDNIVQKVIHDENRNTLNIYPDVENHSNVIEKNSNPILVQKVIHDENNKTLNLCPETVKNSNVIENKINPILVSDNDVIVQKEIHAENRKTLNLYPDIEKIKSTTPLVNRMGETAEEMSLRLKKLFSEQRSKTIGNIVSNNSYVMNNINKESENLIDNKINNSYAINNNNQEFKAINSSESEFFKSNSNNKPASQFVNSQQLKNEVSISKLNRTLEKATKRKRLKTIDKKNIDCFMDDNRDVESKKDSMTKNNYSLNAFLTDQPETDQQSEVNVETFEWVIFFFFLISNFTRIYLASLKGFQIRQGI
jgi:hypothetical protein